jgi:hypothetical protein
MFGFAAGRDDAGAGETRSVTLWTMRGGCLTGIRIVDIGLTFVSSHDGVLARGRRTRASRDRWCRSSRHGARWAPPPIGSDSAATPHVTAILPTGSTRAAERERDQIGCGVIPGQHGEREPSHRQYRPTVGLMPPTNSADRGRSGRMSGSGEPHRLYLPSSAVTIIEGNSNQSADQRSRNVAERRHRRGGGRGGLV